MNLKEIEIVYFLGIGGIGMSALARYFNHHKKLVMGYDRTPTPLTSELEMEGISIHFDDTVLEIPQIIKVTPREKILVIYTPAIPADSNEKNWFLENGFELKKRSEVLGAITASSKTIAIAGTHGKTTTSSLVAHLLKDTGNECNAFLGGITANYNTNLLLGKEDSWTVVEADEFDRSFLTLHPELAVITSMDADHLDIYGDASHVTQGFQLFANRVVEGGTILVKKGLDIQQSHLQKNVTLLHYSISEETDYYGKNIRVENGSYVFDLVTPQGKLSGLTLGQPGRHNIENAIAACAMALLSKVQLVQLPIALASFRGVRRRFETIFKSENITFIDDYAHHPTELTAAINSARELFPQQKITGFFQPHLFTRTRDFADDFASALSLLDEVILLPIYPAREVPIEGVNSQMLLDLMQHVQKRLVSKQALLDLIDEIKNGVIITLGAGDIDVLVPQIHDILKKRVKK
jgi:UDP-N-acetylmuramate--alanine ligase